MTHYYTYEYGWVDADEAVHVYRSKDKMIGLKVRRQRSEGIWSEGYSRFFVWSDDGSGQEFDDESIARICLTTAGRTATASRYRPSIVQQNMDDLSV